MFDGKIMYQENSQIDQITVAYDGTVCIRNANTVTKDGVEISRQYIRITLTPGSDTSKLPDNVQNICTAAWTPEVVAAYQAKIAKIG
jgi:hypothetical protein